MANVLEQYIPKKALASVEHLLETYNVHLKIVNQRKTKHGDYRPLPTGGHQITVNANLNAYKFLITLIHEIAHVLVFVKYKNTVKPHGIEWKLTFQQLMLPLINPHIFPEQLLPVIARHFKNPKASSDTDAALSIALKRYDVSTNKNYIFELELGVLFSTADGRVFRKGNKLRKRYLCKEISSGREYVFQPNAQVELIK